MNNSLTFAFCVILVYFTAKIVMTHLEQRNKKPESNQELDDALSKIDTMEERIRVLERIITENRFDLKKEIDSL